MKYVPMGWISALRNGEGRERHTESVDPELIIVPIFRHVLHLGKHNTRVINQDMKLLLSPVEKKKEESATALIRFTSQHPTSNTHTVSHSPPSLHARTHARTPPSTEHPNPIQTKTHLLNSPTALLILPKSPKSTSINSALFPVNTSNSSIAFFARPASRERIYTFALCWRRDLVVSKPMPELPPGWGELVVAGG